MKYFLSGLLCGVVSLVGAGSANAQVSGSSSVSADTQVFAQRAIESVSGQITDVQPGVLPAELDKRVPLPARARLLGSLVFTPVQYYGQYGGRGSLEILYDIAATDVTAYYADLARAGWLPRGQPGSAILYCKADAPSVIVINGPRPSNMRLSVSRNHPGVDPCATK